MIANAAAWMLFWWRGRAPAVYSGGQVVAYGDLRAWADGCAARLAAEGLAPGDRAAILAENSPFFIAAYLGAMQACYCAVPLPIGDSEKTLERILTVVGAKQLLVSERLLPMAQPLAEKLGLGLIAEPQTRGAGPAPSPPPIDPRRSLAAIMPTSGSTGEPKGVMITHANIACNTRDIIDYMGLSARDRVLVVLPFSYCYGMSLLHTHLAVGGSVVLFNRFMFPEKALDELSGCGAPAWPACPRLTKFSFARPASPKREFPSLRWLQQAGKAAGRFPARASASDAGGAAVCHVRPNRGDGAASYLPPQRLDDKLGSIGKGLPHTRLEVLAADGTPVPPGGDEIGEIGPAAKTSRRDTGTTRRRPPASSATENFTPATWPGSIATDSSSSSIAAATSSRRWAIASAPRKSKR